MKKRSGCAEIVVGNPLPTGGVALFQFRGNLVTEGMTKSLAHNFAVATSKGPKQSTLVIANLQVVNVQMKLQILQILLKLGNRANLLDRGESSPSSESQHP